jgi:hypothetical protein
MLYVTKTGFVKQLPTVAENRTGSSAQTLVKQLWDSRFIDRYTSAIFVESTLYDPTRHALVLLRLVLELPPSGLGAQVPCFTSTKVQILTQKTLLVLPTLEVSAVAVAMLYPQEGGGGYIALEAFVLAGVLVLTCLTCLTGTKVQKLTQEETLLALFDQGGHALECSGHPCLLGQVLRLLALLVQKYKY